MISQLQQVTYVVSPALSVPCGSPWPVHHSCLWVLCWGEGSWWPWGSGSHSRSPHHHPAVLCYPWVTAAPGRGLSEWGMRWWPQRNSPPFPNLTQWEICTAMVRRLIWCKNLSCKPSSCCHWLFGSFHVCELSPGALSRSAPSSEKLAGSTGELTSFVHPSALLGQDKPGEMLSPAEKPIRIDKEELGLLPPGGGKSFSSPRWGHPIRFMGLSDKTGATRG